MFKGCLALGFVMNAWAQVSLLALGYIICAIVAPVSGTCAFGPLRKMAVLEGFAPSPEPTIYPATTAASKAPNPPPPITYKKC